MVKVWRIRAVVDREQPGEIDDGHGIQEGVGVVKLGLTRDSSQLLIWGWLDRKYGVGFIGYCNGGSKNIPLF